MTDNMRKALYNLIPVLVAALSAWGVFSQQTASLWLNVAVIAVGLGYAASKATGNMFLDPEVRRYIYVLAPAVVALIGGYVSLNVALMSSLVVAILGAALATLNVPPMDVSYPATVKSVSVSVFPSVDVPPADASAEQVAEDTSGTPPPASEDHDA